MKKIITIVFILIILYACSNQQITGTYKITTINSQTLEQNGLKSLTIQVQQFKEGKVDIAYYAIDIQSNDYSQNWENVNIDKNGNIEETISNSRVYFIHGNFSDGKCILRILDHDKSKGLNLLGEKNI